MIRITIMRYALFAILISTIASCATAPPTDDDPKSMNWGSHLYPSEIEHLKSLANKGDASAGKRLDSYYSEYLGKEREGLIWLQKAAEAGDPEAEYNFGIMIAVLDESSASQIKARLWIEKAARDGYKPAIEKLVKLNHGEPI